mmetsp:Transcript_12850/g.19504  ORF Transcript_12850/g.19504 Transcript_12850/m.19504 type:complete len:132 (-) Transcript_12850:202-597(-)
MRLLTHNFLKSNVRNTTKGYPLVIEARRIIYEESSLDGTMVKKLCSKIDYEVLVGALTQLRNSNVDVDFGWPIIPGSLGEEQSMDEEVIEMLHKVLFDIHVLDGDLVCPDTGRKFPIRDGIPNMVLHEDEI